MVAPMVRKRFGGKNLRSGVPKRESLVEFRRRVKATREREWRRDALRLRGKSPKETISIMFDLVNFAEKMSRAKKCEA